MRYLYQFSILNPWTAIVVGWGITLAAAPGMLFLRIRTDGHALVPPDSAEIAADDAIRRDFLLEDPVVVLIRSRDPRGVFNFETLSLVEQLTSELRALPEVRAWNVMSLATEKTDRVRPGTLIFRRFLEPPPETEADLERIRDDVRAIRLYTGTLVSRDETATAIFVGAPAGVDRTQFFERIHAEIEGLGEITDEVHVIGAPIAEALLGSHILEDLGVPESVLGHRTYRDVMSWHWPTDLEDFRLLVDRKIGLVPVALALMAAVFLVSFRRIVEAALPLMEVGACLAFVFGIMGYVGVPVYLTIAVMPIILTAVGVADEIHIFARFRDELTTRADSPRVEALQATMGEMCGPVVKTSLTTAVGFLSFSLSPLPPVQAFGAFTAVGVIFCMMWSLTVIPASLALRARRRLPAPASLPYSPAGPGLRFGWLSSVAIRGRWVVLLGMGALIFAVPNGVRRVRVQDSWIDGFAEGSEFYQATQFFNEQFLGTHMIYVCVASGDPAPISASLTGDALDHHGVVLPPDIVPDPAMLAGWHLYLAGPASPRVDAHLPPDKRRQRTWHAVITSVTAKDGQVRVETSRSRGSPRLALQLEEGERGAVLIRKESFAQPEPLASVDALEQFLAAQEDKAVGGVLGPAAFLATTNFMARGRAEGSRTVPPNGERIEWLWKQYGTVRGPERLSQLVDEHFARVVLPVYLKNANFQDTARLLEDIRAYEETHLRPLGMRLAFAGDTPVSQTLIGAIVTTQVRSLIFSLLGILLITSILGRSWVRGLLCVTPCAVAVLVNLAVMGWTGMPLGVATSMFSGMTLGIGVDFAIHYLERQRRHREVGLPPADAARAAMSDTAPAILIDATAIALGFGVMTLSQVPANARLGSLLVLSIVVCLAVTLLLLPALTSVRIRSTALIPRE